jgi:hypothetical protein
MRTLDDPVDLVVYMLEKAFAVALLEPLKDARRVFSGTQRMGGAIRPTHTSVVVAAVAAVVQILRFQVFVIVRKK